MKCLICGNKIHCINRKRCKAVKIIAFSSGMKDTCVHRECVIDLIFKDAEREKGIKIIEKYYDLKLLKQLSG